MRKIDQIPTLLSENKRNYEGNGRICTKCNRPVHEHERIPVFGRFCDLIPVEDSRERNKETGKWEVVPREIPDGSDMTRKHKNNRRWIHRSRLYNV